MSLRIVYDCAGVVVADVIGNEIVPDGSVMPGALDALTDDLITLGRALSKARRLARRRGQGMSTVERARLGGLARQAKARERAARP